VPKIPSGVPEKKPSAQVSETLPSMRPVPTREPAATLPGPLAVDIGVRTPTTGPAPASPDDQDSPDAPPFLPRSGVVPNWTKHEPIRTALPGELVKVMRPETARVIEPYQVKRAALCAYRFMPPDRSPGQVVRVLVVETHLPEDAYGIFTVERTGEISREPGLWMATDSSGRSLTIHVWKGRHYLQLEAQTPGDASLLEACRALIRKITFQMPDASPPELTEAFPRPGLMPNQQWFIRGWASLAGPGAAGLKFADSKSISDALGLDKDTQMVIGTYKVRGAVRPHVVWVVRYETPEEARKAYDRYQAYLDKATDRESGSTMLLRPTGRYLLGTWTAEEESIEPVLPKLRSNLG